MKLELMIQNGSNGYFPAVTDEVCWQTARSKVPGCLTFQVIADDILQVEEGNIVRLKAGGKDIFHGYLFTKKNQADNIMTVTAYDQLRYLKNKDTYVYENRTADALIRMIAEDFRLTAGTLQKTGYQINSRVEDNITLLDMIQNALDITEKYQREIFVFYDDYGKLTLRNIKDMAVDLVIDEDGAVSADHTSSINENSFNKIKLFYDNEDTGDREVYISQDSKSIDRWGILQYVENIGRREEGELKASALLKLYNQKTEKMHISGVIGDIRVRAGSLITVNLNLGDARLKTRMMVESCKHRFREEGHFMDLVLQGGGNIV